MRIQKGLVILLITILITMGVCGCMNGEQEYKNAIETYLKEKYGHDFVVQTVKEGFSGSEGQYIYATCQYDGATFDVYCYGAEGEKTGDRISVEGNSFVIYEKYAEVYFREQLRNALEKQLPEDVFVGCKLRFDCGYALHYSVTKEQFQMGLEDCLNNKDFYSFVTVYVVADENADMDAVRRTVEDYCGKYNAHEQLLFFATAPGMEKETIENHYQKNAERFGSHMLECDLIREMQCTEMKRDKGIIERTTEKG